MKLNLSTFEFFEGNGSLRFNRHKLLNELNSLILKGIAEALNMSNPTWP